MLFSKLVKIKRDIENQIRGLLKNLGLVIGQAKMNVFSVRLFYSLSTVTFATQSATSGHSVISEPCSLIPIDIWEHSRNIR
jgi:hypothetical protein